MPSPLAALEGRLPRNELSSNLPASKISLVPWHSCRINEAPRQPSHCYLMAYRCETGWLAVRECGATRLGSSGIATACLAAAEPLSTKNPFTVH